jgi:PAS domain S-box-containing protein
LEEVPVAGFSAVLKSSRTQLFIVLFILAAGFGTDIVTPRGYTDWVFYLLAVLLAMRIPGRRPLFLIAGMASVFTILGLIFSPPGQPFWISVISRSMALGLIWITVVIASRWRRADEKLRRLDQAVGGAGEIVFMTDLQGIITFINPAFTETYGYKAEEVVGKTTPRILKSGRIAPETYQAFWEMLQSNRQVQGEFINRTKDGRFLTVEASASAIRGSQGNITGYLAIQRDISERKKSEEALRKSEAGLAEAQRIAHIGSWDWDIVNDRAWWSEEMHRIFGMGPAGPVPSLDASLSLMHPDDRSSVGAAIRAAMENGRPFDCDYRIVRPGGEERNVHAQGEVQFDEEHKPVRMVGIVQDVTERKRAEEELKRLNRALRTVSECNQALVRASDEHTLLESVCEILVNHGGFRMAWVGYAEHDEAQSVRMAAFAGHDEGYLASLRLTWADRERGRGPTGTAIRTGRPSIARTIQTDPGFTPWREDALRRGFASSIALPLTLDGKTGGALTMYSADVNAFDAQEVDLLRELAEDLGFGVGALRNRNERERAEKALKKSQEQFLQAQKMEAVGRLAGGVAHDFNNLLTVINGYSDLLLGQSPEGSTERSQLEEIRKAGDRAAALTRQLLAFSRKQIVMPTTLDLNVIVEGMEKMLRRLIGEDIEFVENLHPTLGRVRADAGQIEQVIMNLAINARDAMPKGGTMTVETSHVELDEEYVKGYPHVAPGPYVLLALSDTGCGMDAETQSHIFEPFFTTKGQSKGTGLGLSTAYGIIKQSGGVINVYSEVGRGTTFKIYLKRIDEPAAEISRTLESAAVVTGTETILLVEDEPAVRALAEKTLQSSGYSVLVAGEYIEALTRARQHDGKIHLLLTDVIMPGLNGRELAELLHTLRPAMKVLFISGYTADAIAQHGILDEGVDFLPKPFTPRDLLRKVRQTLDAVKS